MGSLRQQAEASLDRGARFMHANQRQVRNLIDAGRELSNVAFNLKQREGQELSVRDVRCLRLAQEKWDRALRGEQGEGN